MAIIEKTPPTPTYTAADAYELARTLRINSDYDLTRMRNRADKLVLKYLEGSVESYLSPASTTSPDPGHYNTTGTEIEFTDFGASFSPIKDSDAIFRVQRRNTTSDAWNGIRPALWTWDSTSDILTVEDEYEWYRVAYWYETEVLYSDLTESVNYYARRFLSDYFEVIYGEDYEYDYDADPGTDVETRIPGTDTDTDADTPTTKSESVTQSNPANFTVPDDLEISIDSNYSSFGNVFYSFLQYTYASIINDQFSLEFETIDDDTNTEDTGTDTDTGVMGSALGTGVSGQGFQREPDTGAMGAEVSTGVSGQGAQRETDDGNGLADLSEGLSGEGVTNVLKDVGYNY